MEENEGEGEHGGGGHISAPCGGSSGPDPALSNGFHGASPGLGTPRKVVPMVWEQRARDAAGHSGFIGGCRALCRSWGGAGGSLVVLQPHPQHIQTCSPKPSLLVRTALCSPSPLC